MSIQLWKEMPEGFLKKRFKAFDKLDHAVKRLIVDLAKDQKFKCAFSFCDKKYVLEIEHEPGEKLSYTNIRGLVCHRCNLALRAYEMEERGEYSSWENGHPYIGDDEVEAYRYTFECRKDLLIDALEEKRMGPVKYWRKKRILDMLDARYEERRLPWQHRSDETWDGKIRSPEHALRVLAGCMQFVVEQLKKDQNYQPPENFLKVTAQIHPIIEEAKAVREQTATDNAAALTSDSGIPIDG